MSTLASRTNTALLVIDAQNDVVHKAHKRDEVVHNIGALVSTARSADVPVVWVQHSAEDMPIGSDGWKLVPELDPRPSEALVHKTYPDAFEDTDLENVLARASVAHVIVVGAQSDQCVRATMHGAFVRGYDVTLVANAHTTPDNSRWGAPPPELVIAHTNLYWGDHSAPGRRAQVVDTDAAENLLRG